MYIYNSLTKTKETFSPNDPKNIGIYVCGPTVYNRAHIGNARAMVIFDVVYRAIRHKYGSNNVKYVRNITDVDDKINNESKKRGVAINVITEETISLFHKDMKSLNCLPPSIEPRATQHIKQMIDMITDLIEKEHAYFKEGHVLFDVNSYDKYGNLSRRSLDEMIAGARVEIAPYKKNANDFVLWKPSLEDEPGWESPWGFGRPGWHIECSAMSTHYLGNNFDIHGGGADLQFPHHENEIAQSCCANKDSYYAKYWMHNGFLTVDGEKMSKSLGNFITLDNLLEKRNIQGEVVRYALLSSHYRKPLDWTDKLLSDSKKALDSFYKIIREESFPNNNNILEEFINSIYDDINTPKAFSTLHQLVNEYKKETNKERKSVIASKLKNTANMIGLLEIDPEIWLNSNNSSSEEVEYIELLLQKRKRARIDKNWKEADIIRDELKSLSVEIKDNSDGTTSWKKH